MSTPAIAPISPIYTHKEECELRDLQRRVSSKLTKICIPVLVARFVCGDTFSLGQERRRPKKSQSRIVRLVSAKVEFFEDCELTVRRIDSDNSDEDTSISSSGSMRRQHDDVADDCDDTCDCDCRPSSVDLVREETEE